MKVEIVDVEILHKDYPGEYSLSSVFLNPILMGGGYCIVPLPIRFDAYPSFSSSSHSSVVPQRPTFHEWYFALSANGDKDSETMARLHSIRNITPGSIVATAILVSPYHTPQSFYCWNMHSRHAGLCHATKVSKKLHQIPGSTTFRDYWEYLNILDPGLRRKKSVVNVIKKWDEWILLHFGLKFDGHKNQACWRRRPQACDGLAGLRRKTPTTTMSWLDHVLLFWILIFYHCCQYLFEILQRSRWESSVEIVLSGADISMKV